MDEEEEERENVRVSEREGGTDCKGEGTLYSEEKQGLYSTCTCTCNQPPTHPHIIKANDSSLMLARVEKPVCNYHNKLIAEAMEKHTVTVAITNKRLAV